MPKWTLRVKNFFKKEIFHHVLLTLNRKRADFVSIFSPALTKLHLRVHRNVLTKLMIFERDVFFGEFNWKILDLRWSFSTGLSKQHSKCPEESFERFIIGKINQVNFTFLEKPAVGFSELNLACWAFYFEKNCFLFWKPQTLLFNFRFGAKKPAIFPKDIGKLRLKLH